MTDKAWRILQSVILIKNKWLTVRKDHVIMPSGVEMDDYYVLEYPNWVAVIAITKDDNYIMVRQYRHGIQKTFVELCGGRIEKGEDPLRAAKRELKEETGYEGGKWKLFSITASNPSAMNNYCYTFLAVGVYKNDNQKLEITEDIDVCVLTESEVQKEIENGGIIQGDMLSSLWRLLISKRETKSLIINN